jgi:hypothetical protein
MYLIRQGVLKTSDSLYAYAAMAYLVDVAYLTRIFVCQRTLFARCRTPSVRAYMNRTLFVRCRTFVAYPHIRMASY